jgi:HrpA-like RNA helicase
MRRLVESFRACDVQGREFDVDVFAEPRDLPGGGVEWVSTAIARVVGSRMNLPAVRVSGDVFHLTPGGLELTRIRT